MRKMETAFSTVFTCTSEKMVIASPAGLGTKQSFPLNAVKIAGGTGRMPVIHNRQAVPRLAGLSHSSLLAMTRDRKFPESVDENIFNRSPIKSLNDALQNQDRR